MKDVNYNPVDETLFHRVLFLMVISIIATCVLLPQLVHAGVNPYDNVTFNESQAVEVENLSYIELTEPDSNEHVDYIEINGTEKVSHFGRLSLSTKPFIVDLEGNTINEIDDLNWIDWASWRAGLYSGNSITKQDESGDIKVKDSYYQSAVKEHIYLNNPVKSIVYNYSIALQDWITQENVTFFNNATGVNETELRNITAYANWSSTDINLDQYGNAVVSINGAETVILPIPMAVDANGNKYTLSWEIDKTNKILKIGRMYLIENVVYPVVIDPTEMVTNGGFETGTLSGWTTYGPSKGWGSIGVTSSNPHSGTYCADIYADSWENDEGSSGGAETSYIQQSIDITYVNEMTYYAKCSVYPGGDYGGNGQVYVEVESVGIDPTYTGSSGSSGWTGYDADVSALTGSKYIRYYSYAVDGYWGGTTSSQQNARIYADDVSAIANATVAPVTNFSANVTTVTSAQPIAFTDLSTNTPTAWAWDFNGDGFTDSTVQNPIVTYGTAGTYTVSLNASNAAGSDTETKTGYITITDTGGCIACNFSATPTSGNAPLVVQFTDLSAVTPDTWAWSFGDGSTSTEQNPVHTYTTPGTYTVTMTVTKGTAIKTKTKLGYIVVSGIAYPSFKYGAEIPISNPTATDKFQVYKNFLLSSFPSMQSDFRDLYLTTTSDPTSTAVPFWFENTNTGNNASTWIALPASATKIYAWWGNTNVTNCSNGFSTFDYFEPFESGSNITLSGSAARSTTVSQQGTYSAKLAKGSGAPSSMMTYSVSPSGDLIYGMFINPDATPPYDSIFQFSTGTYNSWRGPAVGIGGDGSQPGILSYYASGWHFTSFTVPTNTWTRAELVYHSGSSTFDSVMNGSTIISGGAFGFSTSGLTSFNAYTNSGNTANIYVDNVYQRKYLASPPTVGDPSSIPVANFSASPTTGLSPLTVTFTDSTTGSPTAENWSWGDGTYSTTVGSQSHEYTSAGVYTVSLNASNAAGSYNLTAVNYIQVFADVISSFTANVTSGTIPFSVLFTDTSTGDPDTWYWSFSDGSTSTSANVIKTFTEAGYYSVNHYAYSSTTESGDWENRTDYIQAISGGNGTTIPTAAFSADVTYGNVPLTVQFTDESTQYPTSWSWNFGDGDTSTSQNPSHEYDATGIYSVTLTATNAYGSGTLEKQQYIQVYAAGFGGIYGYVYDSSTSSVISGATLTLQNDSASAQYVSDGNGVYYFWPVYNGVYNLTAAKTGYTTQSFPNTIINGTTSLFNIYLSPTGNTATGINITNYSTDWLSFAYSTDSTTNQITLNYTVTSGSTDYANFTVWAGSVPVYTSNISTQSGTFTYTGSASTNYAVVFSVANSEDKTYNGVFSAIFYRGLPTGYSPFPDDYPQWLLNLIIIGVAILVILIPGPAYGWMAGVLCEVVLAAGYYWGLLNLGGGVNMPVIMGIIAIATAAEYMRYDRRMG